MDWVRFCMRSDCFKVLTFWKSVVQYSSLINPFHASAYTINESWLLTFTWDAAWPNIQVTVTTSKLRSVGEHWLVITWYFHPEIMSRTCGAFLKHIKYSWVNKHEQSEVDSPFCSFLCTMAQIQHVVPTWSSPATVRYFSYRHVGECLAWLWRVFEWDLNMPLAFYCAV